VLAIVLYLFWGYHVYLIYRNTTTNETYKWKDFKRKVLFVQRIKQARAKENIMMGDKDKVPSQIPKEYEALANVDVKNVKNMYDKGLVSNMWGVVFPPTSITRERRNKE
jgi:palmitoyltransferase ZDHHC4